MALTLVPYNRENNKLRGECDWVLSGFYTP